MRKFKIALILSLFSFLFSPISALAHPDSLKVKIEKIIENTSGKIGVTVMDIESKDTLTLNNQIKYPMQSVYKFPLALAVLNQVDKGKLSLKQKIRLDKNNLIKNTWSPLRVKYSKVDTSITLDEILNYTVSKSDNNGCDILFNLVGGTKAVNRYIHNMGVTNISIAETEKEMHKAWDVQFKNWCYPNAMAQLLYKFYNGEILSNDSRNYLMNIMINTVSDSNRIKGLLPQGTVVAHKTGTSDTNKDGVTAATNDAGIITLPNGHHVILVVFVSNSKDNDKIRNEVIAEIGKAVWDAFSTK